MSETKITKMKQGMSYTVKEKVIIMNVFKYFSEQNPELRVTEIVRRTAHATGCSDKSIFQFRKEEQTGFKEPSRTKVRKNLNINSRDIKYDEDVRKAIRIIISNLKDKSIVPSLNKIQAHLIRRDDMPKFSLMTLRRLLFDMGYYYIKNGTKYTLVEQDSKNSKIQDFKDVNDTNYICLPEKIPLTDKPPVQLQPTGILNRVENNYNISHPGLTASVAHSWWMTGYHPTQQVFPS